MSLTGGLGFDVEAQHAVREGFIHESAVSRAPRTTVECGTPFDQVPFARKGQAPMRRAPGTAGRFSLEKKTITDS